MAQDRGGKNGEAERQVPGIAVDILNLAYGLFPDFAVHYLWLPAYRGGPEAVANLDALPARGATLIAGVRADRAA